MTEKAIFEEAMMFSVDQKRSISDAVQKILRDTNHPELPSGDIDFLLHVEGKDVSCWARIRNNGAIGNAYVNPWNELQGGKTLTSR